MRFFRSAQPNRNTASTWRVTGLWSLRLNTLQQQHIVHSMALDDNKNMGAVTVLSGAALNSGNQVQMLNINTIPSVLGTDGFPVIGESFFFIAFHGYHLH